MRRFRLVVRLAVLMLSVAVAAACGVKGPPRPPLRILPAPIAPFDVVRMGERVYVQFAVPESDADGSTPGDIERVEVYAITTQPTDDRPTEPFTDDWLEAATLVATLQVRSQDMLSIPPVIPEDTEVVGVQDPSEDDDPIEDGFVDQGELVTLVEQLTPETMIPVIIDHDDDEEEEDEDDLDRAIPMPFVAPALPRPPVRSYVAFAVSSRRREGEPSALVAVPLVKPPEPPGPATVSYTETTLQVVWDPPDTLRVSPHGVIDVSEGQTAGQQMIESTPIFPGVQSSEYVVFDVVADGDPDMEQPGRLSEPNFESTYTSQSLVFNTPQCYAVRVLDHIGEMQIMGEASPATCVVLTDTFVPLAPTGLIAVSGAGSVNLVWNDNSEPDIASYLVFRRVESGGTFEPLTLEPIEGTAYQDTDVVSGERYNYQVIAIDSAVPPNTSLASDSITETAR